MNCIDGQPPMEKSHSHAIVFLTSIQLHCHPSLISTTTFSLANGNATNHQRPTCTLRTLLSNRSFSAPLVCRFVIMHVQNAVVLRFRVGAFGSWRSKVRIHWLPLHTLAKYLDFRHASKPPRRRTTRGHGALPRPANALAPSCFWLWMASVAGI